VAGIATTVILLVILAGMKPLQERYHDQMHIRPLRVVAEAGCISMEAVQAVSGVRPSRIRQFVTRRGSAPEVDETLITFVRLSRRSVEDIARKLRNHPGVITVEDLPESH
jgi:putative Mg2+ transporter-C (MgtC) family protein